MGRQLITNTVTELSVFDRRAGSRRSPPLPSYPVGNDPDAISSDGTHVWVANDADTRRSVTELSASTGGVVKVI